MTSRARQWVFHAAISAPSQFHSATRAMPLLASIDARSTSAGIAGVGRTSRSIVRSCPSPTSLQAVDAFAARIGVTRSAKDGGRFAQVAARPPGASHHTQQCAQFLQALARLVNGRYPVSTGQAAKLVESRRGKRLPDALQLLPERLRRVGAERHAPRLHLT